MAENSKYVANFRNGKQMFALPSQERAFVRSAWLNQLGSNPPAGTAVSTLPQRVLWAQEPTNILLKRKNSIGDDELAELIRGRQMSMMYQEVPPQIQTSIKGLKNRVDMVLEHSLGFGNESLGVLYDKQNAASAAPTSSAVGTPAPGRYVFMHNVDPATGAIRRRRAPDPQPIQCEFDQPLGRLG